MHLFETIAAILSACFEGHSFKNEETCALIHEYLDQTSWAGTRLLLKFASGINIKPQ